MFSIHLKDVNECHDLLKSLCGVPSELNDQHDLMCLGSFFGHPFDTFSSLLDSLLSLLDIHDDASANIIAILVDSK